MKAAPSILLPDGTDRWETALFKRVLLAAFFGHKMQCPDVAPRHISQIDLITQLAAEQQKGRAGDDMDAQQVEEYVGVFRRHRALIEASCFQVFGNATINGQVDLYFSSLYRINVSSRVERGVFLSVPGTYRFWTLLFAVKAALACGEGALASARQQMGELQEELSFLSGTSQKSCGELRMNFLLARRVLSIGRQLHADMDAIEHELDSCADMRITSKPHKYSKTDAASTRLFLAAVQLAEPPCQPNCAEDFVALVGYLQCDQFPILQKIQLYISRVGKKEILAKWREYECAAGLDQQLGAIKRIQPTLKGSLSYADSDPIQKDADAQLRRKKMPVLGKLARLCLHHFESLLPHSQTKPVDAAAIQTRQCAATCYDVTLASNGLHFHPTFAMLLHYYQGDHDRLRGELSRLGLTEHEYAWQQLLGLRRGTVQFPCKIASDLK